MRKEQVAKIIRKRTKISRVSVVDQVCAAIKQDIADGVWKSGDKIPSEAEFAETFGVNRLSVRMALQKLNTLGIIETRVGEGSYVCDFSLKPVLNEISFYYANKDRYQDVKQLRDLLEYECLRLAVYGATDEEKKQLKEALDAYIKRAQIQSHDPYSEELLANLVDADFNFHYQIIKMSHNKLYKDIYYMVQQLIRDHITRLVGERSRHRYEAGLPYDPDEDTHSTLYNCILNSDTNALLDAHQEMLGIRQIQGLDPDEPEDESNQ